MLDGDMIWYNNSLQEYIYNPSQAHSRFFVSGNSYMLLITVLVNGVHVLESMGNNETSYDLVLYIKWIGNMLQYGWERYKR